MTPRFNVEKQFEKIYQLQLVNGFHSFKESPVRSQPYQRLKNTLLGVTLLEDLITLLGLALLEVFSHFNLEMPPCQRISQIVVKLTLLGDFVHYYNY